MTDFIEQKRLAQAEFENRLSQLLEENGDENGRLTVAKLARLYEARFDEYLSQDTLNGWLTKGVAPGPGRLLKLALLFDVDPYWLWPEADPERPRGGLAALQRTTRSSRRSS